MREIYIFICFFSIILMCSFSIYDDPLHKDGFNHPKKREKEQKTKNSFPEKKEKGTIFQEKTAFENSGNATEKEDDPTLSAPPTGEEGNPQKIMPVKEIPVHLLFLAGGLYIMLRQRKKIQKSE